MLDARGGIQWPYPARAGADRAPSAGCSTTARSFTPDGRARFLFEPTAADARAARPRSSRCCCSPAAARPRSGTRRRAPRSRPCCGSSTRRSVYVEINPEDARRCGIRPNQMVFVESRRGKIKAKAFVTHDGPPGQVFLPMHYEVVNQRLTHPSSTPTRDSPPTRPARSASARSGPGSLCILEATVGPSPRPHDQYNDEMIMIANNTRSRREDRGRHRQWHGRPSLLRAAGRRSIVERDFQIVTFCEEPRPAYDRVNLTKYFDASRRRAPRTGAAASGTARTASRCYVGDRATAIDRERRVVRSGEGGRFLTTSSCWPPARRRSCRRCPGVDKKGVFVYRTIEDLERIIAYGEHGEARRRSSAAVCSGWRRPRRPTTSAWRRTSSSSPRG